MMATATETAYVPRLKQLYRDELCGRLKDELGLATVMEVPAGHQDHAEHGRGGGQDRGEGSRLRDRGADADRGTARPGAPRSEVDRGLQDPRGDADRRARDAARRPHVRLPRSPDLDRPSAHPRLPRPRRGLLQQAGGNYSLGIREQIIFPEVDYDDISSIRGLDVAVTTTATTDEQGLALLRGLGFPFAGVPRNRQEEE